MSASADRWVATGTGPAKVLAAARERLQNGHVGDRVRLTVELDERERAQVGRLLGVAWKPPPKRSPSATSVPASPPSTTTSSRSSLGTAEHPTTCEPNAPPTSPPALPRSTPPMRH